MQSECKKYEVSRNPPWTEKKSRGKALDTTMPRVDYVTSQVNSSRVLLGE